MPNWVTNKITTSPEVIAAVINTEGHVDFNLMAPFPGEFDWGGVMGDAEQMAEIVVGRPVDSHPLVSRLQEANRRDADVTKLSDESFEQFVQMLRNHRKCGYLHQMDFAREEWGTKWNACESSHDAKSGTAQFETAWACPEKVLVTLSKRFPDEEIQVTYADEDIGSNCGSFILKDGEVISSDIAPAWSAQSEADQQKWCSFARDVKGWEEDPDEE